MVKVETQVNIMIPVEIWEAIGELAEKRKREGEQGDTKKAIVAAALDEYYEKYK